MTLHLTKIVRRYRDHSESTRKATTARLANEIAEERMSRELVDRHNSRVRQSAEYRQQGSP